jgi:hypothetical protein
MSRLRARRPTAGLAVACIALFLALGGTGGAVVSQAPPKNSVGTNQLKNNAVTTPKIKNNAVAAAKIASNAVVAAKIAGNAVTAAKIACNAVTTDKVADGSLTAADMAAGVLPPSTAVGRFLNGPIAIPTAQTTVANLNIPGAGNYVIWAKTYVTAALFDGVVTCRLEAGPNFDETQAHVGVGQPASISLMVLNNFAAAGTVNLGCSSPTAKQANFIKITAVQFTNLTNTG